VTGFAIPGLPGTPWAKSISTSHWTVQDGNACPS
jgi:hypothetical protein